MALKGSPYFGPLDDEPRPFPEVVFEDAALTYPRSLEALLMATAPSIKVVKTFNYRGSARQWSNRYYFSDGTPSDTTHWTTFSDAIVTAEKACFLTTTGFTITGTFGYAGGSDVPVFSKTYTTAMTGTFGTPAPTPGDVAALVRYATATRTSKNHPLYLFNYYHGALAASGLDPDTLHSAQKTAFNNYASAWITGFSDGTINHHRCGPNGDLATGVFVSPYLRHRDFPAG